MQTPELRNSPLTIAQMILVGGKRHSVPSSSQGSRVDPDREKILAATWAAFEEVERFYNRTRPRFQFVRYAFSSIPLSAVPSAPLPDGFWEPLMGKYKQTIDQAGVAAQIRQVLSIPIPDDAKFCIVTDQELTPPEGWRYLIWGDCSPDPMAGGIASLAPIDPHYWRIDDRERVARIKHRIRTACLSIVGESTGALRCTTPECFLYDDVESADRLDSMFVMGPGHDGYEDLTGWGFHPLTADPQDAQTPVKEGLSEAAL